MFMFMFSIISCYYVLHDFVANISIVWVIFGGIAAQKCGSPPPAHHPPVMLRSVSMSGAMSSTIGATVGDSVLNEIATARRNKPGISRQDSRLSVKSLIESIENATKQAKTSKGMCVTIFVSFIFIHFKSSAWLPVLLLAFELSIRFSFSMLIIVALLLQILL